MDAGIDKPAALDNAQLAEVFEQIGLLLEYQRENPFKIRAYLRAAHSIAQYPEPLREVVANHGDLRQISGIGEAIETKVLELLATGRLQFLDRLKASVPPGALVLLDVPGIGPRTVARLVQDMGISSVAELDAALDSGAVTGLPGIGEKKAKAMRQALDAYLGRGSAAS